MDKSSKIDQANSIIDNLISEFSKEENKIRVLFDNNTSRLEELDENISNYKKNDDQEYRVFSPRNQSSANTDRLDSLKVERENVDKTISSLSRQLKYYSDKCKKLQDLKDLFSVMEQEEKSSSISDIDDIHEVSVKSSELLSVENVDPPSIDESSSDKLIIVKGELSRILHRMEMINKIIDNDPLRAKIEFNSAISNLSDVIAGL